MVVTTFWSLAFYIKCILAILALDCITDPGCLGLYASTMSQGTTMAPRLLRSLNCNKIGYNTGYNTGCNTGLHDLSVVMRPSLHNIATVYRFTATTVRPLQITTLFGMPSSGQGQAHGPSHNIRPFPGGLHGHSTVPGPPPGTKSPADKTLSLVEGRVKALRYAVNKYKSNIAASDDEGPGERLSGIPSTNTSRTLRLVTMKT
ncbi:hypothetical protein GE09DRAFT_1242387 [Coniochaeta sp. 2T2.1]|nr:hypothetical protein GE09DRAFT_1242387 [Coniochaeta sp. 2T2.1]